MNRKIALSIILICILTCTFFLLTQPLFLEGLLLILGVLTLLWLVSLLIRDSSIIDWFWGIGFTIIAWYYFSQTSDLGNIRNIVLCSMVNIWGLRLALHLFIRNTGKGEDYRYQEFRRQGGAHYWWISYFRVFVLQGFFLWIISSCLLPAMSDTALQSFTIFDYAGITIWVIGFYFEFVGDWQLANFKRNPANKGKVMDKGLWKYTRHPNYFGDALLWWGYFMFAVSVGAYWFVFSPLLMTFMLMRVSGVVLLEEKLKQSKPEYADYIKNTPAFFPFKL